MARNACDLRRSRAERKPGALAKVFGPDAREARPPAICSLLLGVGSFASALARPSPPACSSGWAVMRRAGRASAAAEITSSNGPRDTQLEPEHARSRSPRASLGAARIPRSGVNGTVELERERVVRKSPRTQTLVNPPLSPWSTWRFGWSYSMTTSGSLPPSPHATQLSRLRRLVPSTTNTSGPRKSFDLTWVSLK